MAVVVVAASFLLRYFLVQGLGLELPLFIFFYPAVMVVAVLAGFWPGLLATALAVLVTDYTILPPFGFAIAKTSDAIALVLFAAMGIFMSLLAEHYRRSLLSIAAYKEEQARHESDVLYRGLFDSMNEGFSIIEMIFDSEGKPADYRFLEINAAFEKQTGCTMRRGNGCVSLPRLMKSFGSILMGQSHLAANRRNSSTKPKP
jgi:PAS domain-containing protein